MPALVEKCIESIYRNSNGFEVCLIDKDNYSHYISIPDYILDKRAKGVISFAAFSDYIRFKLLQKYGGWYCDATIYATKRFQESPSIYTAKSIEDPRFISRGLWSSFLWYLPWGGYSFPNFIISALDDYWSKHDEIIDYFLIDNLIMIFYEMNSVFRKSIDSLVIDNPDLYFFQSQQSFSDYDDSIWQSVKSRNRFFKCNRRTVSSNKKSFHFTLLGQ